MNSFNFRGKASRTEYAYFLLFYISSTILYLPLYMILLGNPYDTEEEFSINPISETLFFCFVLVFLFISFSTIALTFRRCRDIGYAVLVLVPCIAYVFYVVVILDALEIINIENTELLNVLFLLSLVLLIAFPLFLLFKKGKAHIPKTSENNGYSSGTEEKKNRNIVLAVVSIAYLVSLFVFHFNYEYTDWWIDEWIIICSTLGIYIVIIAICYFAFKKRYSKHK